MSETEFPNIHTLCERCGYPLRGLAADTTCPECGQPIEDSHPRLRTGPPWQNHASVATACSTVLLLVTHPRRHFRTMRIDGSNLNARMYLLAFALLAGVIMGLAEWGVLARPVLLSFLIGMATVKVVILVTYIEVLGVAYVSRRRGWRVPLKLAERVACYASPGLLLAAVLILKLRMLWRGGWLPLPRWLLDQPGTDLLIVVVPLAVSVLGFEILVWLGARQVRYANA